MLLSKSVLSRLEHQMPCKKCGAAMKRGVAIEQTYTGTPDFAGCDVCTMSPGGSGKLVTCLKCQSCGFSIR